MANDFHTDLAALDWQVELGADEAILDTPVDRYAPPEPVVPAAAPGQTPPPVAKPQKTDPAKQAASLAEAAADLPALLEAMRQFDGCELRRGARNFVCADGHPGARLMVIGDAPNRDDDRTGQVLTGAEGRLFDAMFGAIGLSRAEGLYVALTCPWRAGHDGIVSGPDLALMKPFLTRHIELAAPEVLVLMGNAACSALLGESGLSRLRGTWREVMGRPALPLFPPARLLETPALKREAWSDLLEIKAKLGSAQ